MLVLSYVEQTKGKMTMSSAILIIGGYLITGLPVGVYLGFAAFVASGINLWGTGTTRSIIVSFLFGWLFFPIAVACLLFDVVAEKIRR